MRSLILSVSARWIVPVMLLFSLYLLLRGHHLPGGGFIAGLTASVGLILHALSFGVERTQKVFKVNGLSWICGGLLLALFSGMWGLIMGHAFLEGYWLPTDMPVLSSLGTPLLFDLGVYLVVLGSTLLITFGLLKE